MAFFSLEKLREGYEFIIRKPFALSVNWMLISILFVYYWKGKIKWFLMKKCVWKCSNSKTKRILWDTKYFTSRQFRTDGLKDRKMAWIVCTTWCLHIFFPTNGCLFVLQFVQIFEFGICHLFSFEPRKTCSVAVFWVLNNVTKSLCLFEIKNRFPNSVRWIKWENRTRTAHNGNRVHKV